MDDKKELAWAKYVFDIEMKFEAWSWHRGATLDDYVANNNARGYDRVFRVLQKRCQAPGCRYPLPDVNNFEVFGYGPVCNLCHTMHSLLSGRAYWVAIQQREDDDRKKRR